MNDKTLIALRNNVLRLKGLKANALHELTLRRNDESIYTKELDAAERLLTDHEEQLEKESAEQAAQIAADLEADETETGDAHTQDGEAVTTTPAS